MVKTAFEMFLFTTDTILAAKAIDAGVSGIIVDWENKGKGRRQANADTQINFDTPEDLNNIRNVTKGNIICRINNSEETSELKREIDTAIKNGADEILLPMVRTPDTVEVALKIINNRTELGILIETVDAIKNATSLGSLPLSRVYVGLNDLTIDRNGKNIFEPLTDGTVESIRDRIKVPFGFGGLTLPELGSPVPCSLFMSEMARLECSFSFLRRSFLADISPEDYKRDVPKIAMATEEAFRLPADKKLSNKKELRELILQLIA